MAAWSRKWERAAFQTVLSGSLGGWLSGEQNSPGDGERGGRERRWGCGSQDTVSWEVGRVPCHPLERARIPSISIVSPLKVKQCSPTPPNP